MATITIKLDFLVCETSINTFLCKFYYYDNVNSRIMPWTAQQSTKQDALALMQTYSNDLYTSLLNIEGITPLGGGSVTDYGTYSEMSFDIVVETGSQSQDIDYTQILTSINSNLASIASKNNQSDIVNCLNNIFCYSDSNNNFISSIKFTNSPSALAKTNLNLSNLLFNLLQLLSNKQVTMKNLDEVLNAVNFSCFSDISKKLSIVSYASEQDTILGALTLLRNVFVSDYANTASNARHNSYLKQISDKLANANDLHTISQAIDLISTAIAQTPTTDTTNLEQGLTEIKESIDNKDNVLIVDGEQTFKFRDKDS